MATKLSNTIVVQNSMVVYPNPNNGEASISYTMNENIGEASINVTDILGNVVRTYPLNDHKGVLSISQIELSSGIYFCTLKGDGKKIATQKFSKF